MIKNNKEVDEIYSYKKAHSNQKLVSNRRMNGFKH